MVFSANCLYKIFAYFSDIFCLVYGLLQTDLTLTKMKPELQFLLINLNDSWFENQDNFYMFSMILKD